MCKIVLGQKWMEMVTANLVKIGAATYIPAAETTN